MNRIGIERITSLFAFAEGAEASASLAAQYPTTHPYRLDDCILGKLNLSTRKKPRKNLSKIQEPGQAWVAGFCVALAESHRLLVGGNDSSGVCRVAASAGVTMASAKEAGVSPYDLRELKKAGLK